MWILAIFYKASGIPNMNHKRFKFLSKESQNCLDISDFYKATQFISKVAKLKWVFILRSM